MWCKLMNSRPDERPGARPSRARAALDDRALDEQVDAVAEEAEDPGADADRARAREEPADQRRRPADAPATFRAAAATWAFRGDESRRGRGPSWGFLRPSRRHRANVPPSYRRCKHDRRRSLRVSTLARPPRRSLSSTRRVDRLLKPRQGKPRGCSESASRPSYVRISDARVATHSDGSRRTRQTSTRFQFCKTNATFSALHARQPGNSVACWPASDAGDAAPFSAPRSGRSFPSS
mmetsp:Transcript_7384/g.22688  ORF Transcript_7384/g.22688 Transcript_7384/m.22688 type:complete len:236 (+) Transcript_7384:16-723(+)